MKCPTYHELLDYMINDFQTEEEKATMKAHVDGCLDCSQQVQALEPNIAAMIFRAEQECDLVRENLMEYIDGKIATVSGIKIKEHLAECNTCSVIHQQLTANLSVEQGKALGYQVPERLTRNLKRMLAEAANAAPPAAIGERLKQRARDLVDRLVLVLAPAPEPAFLGGAITGEASVEITGSALEVNAGAAGRVVKIFSPKNEELDRQISDQAGLVVFKDFEPGRYKIVIEGFVIKEVK